MPFNILKSLELSILMTVIIRRYLAQITYSTGNYLYIKPDDNSIKKDWADAQQYCKTIRATLAILDTTDRQSVLSDALYYFGLNDTDIWLGAKATYSSANNWTWLDGTTYRGSVGGAIDYQNSYATIHNSAQLVSVNASISAYVYPYICQYKTTDNACTTAQNKFMLDVFCYVTYNENLPWFSARNKCLSNGGDLGVFRDLSQVSTYLTSTRHWIGLRSSGWVWENAVTDQVYEMTFSSWSQSQPNDNSPGCMMTDNSYSFQWRDGVCSYLSSFLCQKELSSNNTSSRTPSTTLKTSSSTTTTTPTSIQTITFLTSTFSSVPGSHINSDVNTTLVIGIAVGAGVPIIIVVIIILAVLLYKRKPKKTNEIERDMPVKSPDYDNTNRTGLDQTDLKKPKTSKIGKGLPVNHSQEESSYYCQLTPSSDHQYDHQYAKISNI